LLYLDYYNNLNICKHNKITPFHLINLLKINRLLKFPLWKILELICKLISIGKHMEIWLFLQKNLFYSHLVLIVIVIKCRYMFLVWIHFLCCFRLYALLCCDSCVWEHLGYIFNIFSFHSPMWILFACSFLQSFNRY